MLRLIFVFLVSFVFSTKSYSQSSKSFFAIGKLGVNSDIPREEISFGGGLGLGINFNDQPNRWQAQINLDYFALNPEKVNQHGFRRFSAMIQFGRMWAIKLNQDSNLRIGGGVLGAISLNPNHSSWGNQTTAPAVGAYFRIEYPLTQVNGRQIDLIFDNAVFGDGYMRNVLGVSYQIGKRKLE